MRLKNFTSFTSIKEIVRSKRFKQKAKRHEKNQKRKKSRKNKRNKEKRFEPKNQHEAQHQFLHPLSWRRPGHLDHAFHADSAAYCHRGFETPPSSHPSPNPTRSSTLSSILSSGGTSLSSATSKIRFLFHRRHSDTGISRSSPLSRQLEKRNSVPGLSPTFSRPITEESRQDSVPPRAEGVITKSVAPKQEASGSARVMAQQSIDLKAARERLKAWGPTSEAFSTIYESKIRPQLLQILEENNPVDDYTVAVHNDNGSMTRVVVVTTPMELPADNRDKIESHIVSCFSDSEELRVAVRFLKGNVKRTASTLASSQDADSESKRPRNSGRHNVRMLGDSVSFEDSDSAATLGPAISLGGYDGWIVNWHLFHGIANWEHLHDPSKVPLHSLVHPAYIDCRENEPPFRIGELQAYSGRMYRTTRQSRSLERYVAGVPGERGQNVQVVTDWAFCKAYKDEAQNCLRYAPPGIEVDNFSDPIQGVFEQHPQCQIVQTTGRSSGFRYAVVCEAPADVRQYPNMPTREWYLQNIDGVLTSEEWNSEGSGVCGDSGAAVVHDETGELLGQIWGRNVYDDDSQTPRITYFTHYWDIFDDIKERYPNLEGPSLIPKPKCHPSNNANARDGAPSPSRAEADEKTLNPSRPRSRACSSMGGADGVFESFSQSTLAQSVTNLVGSGEGKAKQNHVGKALEGEMGCGQRDSHSRNPARTSADDDTDVLVMRRSSAMVTV
ncbi:uncharacterized protein BDZ83DRAFT_639583 [Colletotrichum acutatum]|uniref:Uncharacterized protein n=1 Tax=Glomerella acutata TaxID=27357 RepID=A0AAD8UCW4_GLOAC|nr:uncharacterized protein BDZ83DRAFT_639583 [Colletotrichum acutatum]KAK1711536.1 hypothetical protein BDZ83DRAFT_639583 [Colletotrichum acutatum]